MAKKLTNITLDEYRSFLICKGCKCYRTTGGHEHWTKTELTRPITLQTHISPVPSFIIKQHLRYLGLTTKNLIDHFDSN